MRTTPVEPQPLPGSFVLNVEALMSPDEIGDLVDQAVDVAATQGSRLMVLDPMELRRLLAQRLFGRLRNPGPLEMSS